MNAPNDKSNQIQINPYDLASLLAKNAEQPEHLKARSASQFFSLIERCVQGKGIEVADDYLMGVCSANLSFWNPECISFSNFEVYESSEPLIRHYQIQAAVSENSRIPTGTYWMDLKIQFDKAPIQFQLHIAREGKAKRAVVSAPDRNTNDGQLKGSCYIAKNLAIYHWAFSKALINDEFFWQFLYATSMTVREDPNDLPDQSQIMHSLGQYSMQFEPLVQLIPESLPILNNNELNPESIQALLPYQEIANLGIQKQMQSMKSLFIFDPSVDQGGKNRVGEQQKLNTSTKCQSNQWVQFLESIKAECQKTFEDQKTQQHSLQILCEFHEGLMHALQELILMVDGGQLQESASDVVLMRNIIDVTFLAALGYRED